MGKGAVILEFNSSHVTLLTDEGAFLRMPVKRLQGARYVGQHVDLDEAKSCSYGHWVSVAAACLIFLLVIPLFQPTPVQAWVTLDGSSSLEVLVDSKFRILEVRPLNAGAIHFLESFNSEKASFSALLDGYLTWSSQSGDSTLLVTSTEALNGFDEFFLEQLSDLEIILIGVDPLARDEAKKLGISAGRALFLAAADTQGLTISVDQIKDDNPFVALSSAGADMAAALTGSSDRSTQVEKIKLLPPSNNGNSGVNNDPPGGDQEPSGQEPNDDDKTPPDQNPKDDDETPPDQSPKDDDKTPPDQNPKDDDKTPPGQSPKDDDKTPPGQNPKDDDKSPPGQSPKDDDKTPPGQSKNEDQAPPGLRDKLLPNTTNPPPTWRNQNTGPPFVPPGQQKKKNN